MIIRLHKYVAGIPQSGISLNLSTGPTGHVTLFNQGEGTLVFINKQIKHRPSDQKFSKKQTESDRIIHRFEALRHSFKTFHEAYTIFF